MACIPNGLAINQKFCNKLANIAIVNDSPNILQCIHLHGWLSNSCCNRHLFQSSRKGSTGCLLYLLNAKADPNVSHSGSSCLHVVDNAKCAELLLANGAKLTTKDEQGKTALQVMAELRNYVVMKVFLLAATQDKMLIHSVYSSLPRGPSKRLIGIGMVGCEWSAICFAIKTSSRGWKPLEKHFWPRHCNYTAEQICRLLSVVIGQYTPLSVAQFLSYDDLDLASRQRRRSFKQNVVKVLR